MPSVGTVKKGTKAERMEVTYPETGGHRYPAVHDITPYHKRVLDKAIKDGDFKSSKHLGETNERWADLNDAALKQAWENIKSEREWRKKKNRARSAKEQAAALRED